jgi:hypothetical protein
MAFPVRRKQSEKLSEAALKLHPFFFIQGLMAERLHQRSCRRDKYENIGSDRHGQWAHAGCDQRTDSGSRRKPYRILAICFVEQTELTGQTQLIDFRKYLVPRIGGASP